METTNKKNVLVLGGGIMGISAAYQLLLLPGKPYSVTIVSEFFTPGTVSDKSGLLVETFHAILILTRSWTLGSLSAWRR
jgi:glycine/D-amino acid oxidase-like deaminating enzyme